MERYAPTMKDLASRDVVSRAMATEIKEGRGAGRARRLRAAQARPPRARDHRQAPARHPRNRDEVRQRRSGEGADPGGAHRALPDGRHPDQLPRRGDRAAGRQSRTVVPGFYAAGECGCASIHGANRLGTNSLTDLLVMGKSSGMRMVEFLKGEGAAHTRSARRMPATTRVARLARLDTQTGGEQVHEVRGEMQRTMQAHCGVFRFPDLLDRRREARSRRWPSARSAPRSRTSPRSSTPRASRRWSWTT